MICALLRVRMILAKHLLPNTVHLAMDLLRLLMPLKKGQFGCQVFGA